MPAVTINGRAKRWPERKAPQYKLFVRAANLKGAWRVVVKKLHDCRRNLSLCREPEGGVTVTVDCESLEVADWWQALVRDQLASVGVSRLGMRVGFRIETTDLLTLRLPAPLRQPPLLIKLRA